MKEIVVKHTPQEIAELLESDDELPDSFVETPDIPAYLDNNRFSKREADIFYGQRQVSSQTRQSKEQSCTEEAIEETSSEYSESTYALQHTLPEAQVLQNDKQILISKGLLTKQDIFLIKSIEEHSTDTTLLWFINFLSNKAVKPPQRSCLVGDMTLANSTVLEEAVVSVSMRYYLKLIVK